MYTFKNIYYSETNLYKRSIEFVIFVVHFINNITFS